jgi:molybdopterin-guanine dinucleotide biosynthesis protein A
VHHAVNSPAPSLKSYDAILLAGGQSRRLKSDKVHLELACGGVLANLIDLCRDLFGHVFLVVDRPGRVTPPHPDVRVLADEIPGSGPLGGILTGLRAAISERCFVTACDLPFLNHELIRFVARHIENQDVLVPGRGRSIEPLMGFYSRNCCDTIQQSIEEGDLRVRGFWPKVNTEVVELEKHFDTADLRTWLLNVNTRHDLEIAEAVAASGSWR